MRAIADPSHLFAEAERAFAAGDWVGARTRLDRVIGMVGEHAAVRHLSGLVHRRLGSAPAAVADLRQAARLAPTDAQIANNLGNALTDLGEGEQALAAYRRAVALDDTFADARRNLGHALCDGADWEEAVAIGRRLTRDAAARPDSWSLLGRALLGADRLDEAADAFERTLALDPVHIRALAGRASVALRRGEADAADRHLRALDRAPDDPDLLVGWVQTDPDEAALERLRERLRREPLWLEGHRTYARLASERGDAVDATLSTARTAEPDDASLALTHLATLHQADDWRRALEVFDALPTAWRAARSALEVAGASALSLGDLERAQTAFDTLALSDADAADRPLAWLSLRRGDPAATAARLMARVERGTAGVSDWAHLSLAWRLLGDAREEWLHGQPGLIRTIDLLLGTGELTELGQVLRGLHQARAHPLGQSMRGGTQTPGRLFARLEPVLRRLDRTLGEAVEAYRADLPPVDPAHPVLRHRSRSWAITGSWSVRLSGAGFHVNHVHPNGVVSSAFYVRLPEPSSDADPHAGWLALGQAPEQLALDLPPSHLIEPAPGRLALFPSTLFHGTVPFRTGERLTVAFDAGVA